MKIYIIEQMKLYFFKNYCNVVLVGDDSLTLTERIGYLWKSLLTFAPIAWIMDIFNIWFGNNSLFFTGIILFIFINMILGAWMNKKKNTFSWHQLIYKTMTMIVVVLLTYLILEITLKVAGSNLITESFRVALQVATLLYPASKILKNVFILSKGEHPPQWIMEKIYNFQKNGDLAEFLSSKKEKEEQIEN